MHKKPSITLLSKKAEENQILQCVGLTHTEVQYWHVSPQCQFSAKCFSGQASHSVGVSAVQCRFTAVPGGHWSHIRRSEVTVSRYWYFGGTPCCWKAQEREAVTSCKRKESLFSTAPAAVAKSLMKPILCTALWLKVQIFFILFLYWSICQTKASTLKKKFKERSEL